jgi:glycosyltransferase involved in cell wall biosynthesis
MGGYHVGVVIPALNESASIVGVVEASKLYGEVIVVNDGSTDNTGKLAEQAGAVVVSHEINRGYDAALNAGFKKAAELRCAVVVSVDADGQHDPLLIQKFIDEIVGGSDVVVGLRSRKQRFAEHLFAWYTSLRFGIKDPLCGMKAYRLEVYEALGHFDSYGSIGTELTIFAAMKGYRLQQVPFVVKERADQSRFGRALLGNLKILRSMLLSLWRCR